MTPAAVSVIIPTYNRARLIGRAVRSAINSCSDADEIIVVDDGSTDETAEVLRSFRDRIRHVMLPHKGAGATRNYGVRMARSPLVAFLDSDDEWIAGYLEAKRRLMQVRPDILFCFSDFAHRAESGQIDRNCLAQWHGSSLTWSDRLGAGLPLSSLIQIPPGVDHFPVHIGNMYHHEMSASYIATFTLMVRKGAAGDALHFAEDLPTYEDWECFGRLSGRGLGAYLASETAWQHGHAEPRLTDADTIHAARARIAVLQRVWGMDVDYLAKHAREFRSVLTTQQHVLIRALLRNGNLEEARELLSRLENAPVSWRVLSRLPRTLVQQGIHARTLFHRALRGT